MAQRWAGNPKDLPWWAFFVFAAVLVGLVVIMVALQLPEVIAAPAAIVILLGIGRWLWGPPPYEQ